MFSTPTHARPRRRRAFTTVELLVAIGIVVILAALSFAGMRVLGNNAKSRTTRTTLETARALLAEVEIAKAMPYVRAVYTSAPNATINFPNAFPPLSRTSAAGAPTPIPAPSDGNLGGHLSEERFFNVRFASLAIVRTQMVMARCNAIASNRALLAQLPASSLLQWNYKPSPPRGLPGLALQFTRVGSGANTRYVWSPPVLVDAWDNPIIYVPPAGLSGVTFAGKPAAKRVVTSVRVRDNYAPGENFEPGATGFWASAGPDGDFTKGDDNLYSFE